MFPSTSSCSRCRPKASAEHVLPQLDSLALSGLVVGGGDRVQRLLGRSNKQIAVLCLIVLGHVVVEIDRIEDLDRLAPAGRQFRRRVEVGESDLAVKAAVDNEGEELLERLRIVVESQSAIGQMDPQQFKHEALALEITIAPSLPCPPLREPDELREVRWILLLAATDKVQVPPHAGPQPSTVILADEVAHIVRLALIEHRDNINLNPAAREPDIDAVGAGDDLVFVQKRIRLDHAVAQPVHECRRLVRRLLSLHIDGKIMIVDGPERSALSDGAGVKCLDKAVARRSGDLVLNPLTKPLDLSALIIEFGPLQVDLLVSEQDKIAMCDLWGQLSYTFHSVVTNTTLLSPVRLTGANWIRPQEVTRR